MDYNDQEHEQDQEHEPARWRRASCGLPNIQTRNAPVIASARHFGQNIYVNTINKTSCLATSRVPQSQGIELQAARIPARSQRLPGPGGHHQHEPASVDPPRRRSRSNSSSSGPPSTARQRRANRRCPQDRSRPGAPDPPRSSAISRCPRNTAASNASHPRSSRRPKRKSHGGPVQPSSRSELLRFHGVRNAAPLNLASAAPLHPGLCFCPQTD